LSDSPDQVKDGTFVTHMALRRSFNPYHEYIQLHRLQALWQPVTSSPGEVVVRTAGTALECTFLLLNDALLDQRPAARSAVRVDALCRSALRQLWLVRGLFGGFDDPHDTALGHAVSVHSIARQLDNHDVPAVRGIRALEAALFRDLGYGLGIWGAAAGNEHQPMIPYDSWVNPVVLAQIHCAHRAGAEDALFAGVHRITECWFSVIEHLLGDLTTDSPDTAANIEMAAAILGFLGDHIQILDAMNLEDYHPLRVALKGSSGAQSSAARRVTELVAAAEANLSSMIARRGVDLVTVLRNPSDHVQPHRLMEAVASLAAASASFFFHHYQRAVRVQSRRGLGALGGGVEVLTRRFAGGGATELDDARFAHVVLSNLDHAASQGTLVARSEAEAGVCPPSPVPAEIRPPDAVRRAELLRTALLDGDLAGVVACFAADAVVEDPAGSRPYRGAGEIKVWIEGLLQGADPHSLDGRLRGVRDGTFSFDWVAAAVNVQGRSVRLTGRADLSFSSAGMITRLCTYWNPGLLARTAVGPAPAGST
jgi:steroid Delta-isomerase